MEKKSTNTERRIPCEFCNEEVVILYCRADSAKLYLFCDFQVHSANDLLRKHVRSQICDNCSSQPVSVRCGTDNLVRCQDCDWDSHGNCSVSANHERNPMEGFFSGCSMPLELGSFWGFDLGEKKAAVPISPMMQECQENNGGFENWSSIDSLSIDLPLSVESSIDFPLCRIVDRSLPLSLSIDPPLSAAQPFSPLFSVLYLGFEDRRGEYIITCLDRVGDSQRILTVDHVSNTSRARVGRKSVSDTYLTRDMRVFRRVGASEQYGERNNAIGLNIALNCHCILQVKIHLKLVMLSKSLRLCQIATSLLIHYQ